MTSNLPFLIAHDTRLGWALVALVVVAVIAGLGALRRRGARRDTRARVDLVDTGDAGVVRGKLGGGQLVSVAAISGYVADVADWSGGSAWIDNGVDKIAIAGTVRVIAGSRAAASRNGVPAQVPDAVLALNDKLHRQRPPWRSSIPRATYDAVAPGDEVIARGRVSGEPGALQLLPLDDGLIQLAARQPASAIARRPLGVYLLIAVFAGLAGWRIAAAAGTHWADACDDTHPPDNAPLVIGNTHACSLAAAMPGSRASALAHARWVIKSANYHDATRLANLVALTRVTEKCNALVEVWMDAEHYAEAADEAHRCGDRRSEHLALLWQGKLDQAVAIDVPATDSEMPLGLRDLELPTGPELIALGHWTQAAAAADRAAKRIRASHHSWESPDDVETRALGYQCLGELLRAWSGDAAAPARLRQLAEHGNEQCTVAASQLGDAGEQPRTSIEAGRVLQWLAGKGDGVSKHPLFVLANLDEAARLESPVLAWVAKLAASKLPADASHDLRVATARWSALAHVLDGDLGGAASAARDALALDPSGSEDLEVLEDQFLPAAVALYTPASDVALPAPADNDKGWHVEEAFISNLRLRHGDALRAHDLMVVSDLAKSLIAAEHGDGSQLAIAMGGGFWTATTVLAVLPRITTGRDAVARALVWCAPSDATSVPSFPWGMSLAAAARRTALSVAGEPAEAAKWDAVYRSFDHAVSDPKKLAALVLWGDED